MNRFQLGANAGCFGGGGVQVSSLDLHTHTHTQKGGSSFGPNVKKPKLWAQGGGGGRPPGSAPGPKNVYIMFFAWVFKPGADLGIL